MKIERTFAIGNRGKHNMKLKNAVIEGFRNIEHSEIAFEDITSLVSINSYGKSNLLDALDFGLSFISIPPEEKEQFMSWTDYMPFNKYIDNKNFSAEYTLSTLWNEKTYIIKYSYEFVWLKNEGGKEVVKEKLAIREDAPAQKFMTLIDRDKKSHFKASQTGRCDSVCKVNSNELVLNKLLLNDQLYYHEIIEEMNKLKMYVERHFDANSRFEGNRLIRKNADILDLEEINSIPKVIYYLKENHSDKYELLMDAFHQVMPNIESIEIQAHDFSKQIDASFDDIPFTLDQKVYAMFVKDVNMNQMIGFKGLSAGAKRIFLMFTYLVVADINGTTIIALEEPENSIHPNLLQSFISIISQLAGDCQIILSSHSPFLIQYVKTESVYVGVPNNEGLAKFSKISKKKLKLLYKDAIQYSNSVGSYIFELLSGSLDDIEILKEYLEN